MKHTFPPSRSIRSLSLLRFYLWAPPLLLGLLFVVACAKPEAKSAAKAEDKDKKTKTVAEVIKTAEKLEGLFPLYRDRKTGKVHLQLTKEQLGREFVLFSYIENGLPGVGHFRGQYRGARVVVFQRDYEKISVVSRNTAFYFDPASPLRRASRANLTEATLAVQRIVAEDEKTGVCLIEADGIFLTDHLEQIKPSEPEKKDAQRFTLGKLSGEKSRFVSLRNYPANSDFLVEYVFEEKAPTGRTADDVTDPRYVSVQFQYSLIAMPENDYRLRLADERVGYFTTENTDLTTTSATPYRDLVHRWHLKKKDPAADISDPVEPITWWIENTTPLELRPVIQAAALQWNKAFLAAGFSNALEVREQPDDAVWDAGDIRYNVLRWTSSPNPPFGGYGPSFVNPRTGQILGADIMLEWSFLSNRVRYERLFGDAAGSGEETGHADCRLSHELHASLLAGQAALKFDGAPDVERSRLQREGLYYLVIHEIGHTLGLNHNMKSSQLHDARSVHDAAVTEPVGLTGSIMDYPAVNLAPVGVPQGQFYSTAAGPYDVWAIEFGYSDRIEDPARRAALLARSVEPALQFGNDADDMRQPGRGIDPRVMIGDMSSDAIAYATQRVERVRAALGRAAERYDVADGSLHELRDALVTLTREHAVSARVISRYVGGVYVERAAPGQPGAPSPLRPVPAETQRRAVTALTEQVFAPGALALPEKLLTHARLTRRGFDFFRQNEDLPVHEHLLQIPGGALDHVLHPRTLARLADTGLYGAGYAVDELLASLTDAIFAGDAGGSADSIRRTLQADYVRRLLELIEPPAGAARPDPRAAAAVWAQLEAIRTYPWRMDARVDAATLNHRRHLAWRIGRALDPAPRRP